MKIFRQIEVKIGGGGEHHNFNGSRFQRDFLVAQRYIQ